MAKKRKNTKGAKQSYASLDDESDGPMKGPTKATRSSARKKAQKGKYDNGNSSDDYVLRQSVEADGKYSIIDMNPDGNCLFRSLSDQLYRDYGSRHDQVRSDVCDYMQDNADDFSVFLVLEDDGEEEEDAANFESYIENMRADGQWGGNLELVAAARIYRRKITVFSATLAAFTIDHGEGESLGPDLLVSFHDNDHYNSVRDNSALPKSKSVSPLSPEMKKKGQHEAKRKTAQDHGRSASSYEENSGKSDDDDDEDEQRDDVPLSSSIQITAGDSAIEIQKQPTKPRKKTSPCPCGSGLIYRKCCGEKNKKLQKMKGGGSRKMRHRVSPSGDQEFDVKGNFRVLQI